MGGRKEVHTQHGTGGAYPAWYGRSIPHHGERATYPPWREGYLPTMGYTHLVHPGIYHHPGYTSVHTQHWLALTWTTVYIRVNGDDALGSRGEILLGESLPES